ncbi:MAG: hypothetical protein ACK4IK_06890 [Bacteroidia bacterium]
MKKAILYFTLIATINLFFCVPQQNEFFFNKDFTIYSTTEHTENEIQSVIELICEAVFDTEINLPVDEEAAIFEKDFLTKRINRSSFSYCYNLSYFSTKINVYKHLSEKSFLNFYNSKFIISSGYSFIFRLTPF